MVKKPKTFLNQGKAISEGTNWWHERFEALSDLTLPASHKMMCRFQFCLQRYLADPVIRDAKVSYKKPGMNVAQVRRSTLHRNPLFDDIW